MVSDQYVATVNYGGGVLSYSEDAKAMGVLHQVASQLLGLSSILEQGLNARAAQLVSQHGASFQGGTVSGNAQVTIRPAASGVAHITVSGLSYQMRSQYSGHKWGIIHYTCTNTLTFSNVVIDGQYGTATGVMQDDKTGMTATTNSSTDCDSNLSWIMPVIGDVLIDKAEGKIDGAFQKSLQAGLAQFKDALLYKPDQNLLNGLSRLVPPGKTVALPGGGAFPLGQYIQNNSAYLLGNSQLSIQLGGPVALRPVLGVKPSTSSFTSDMVTIALSSPALAFTVKLSEQVGVNWQWFCVPIDRNCPGIH